MLSPVSLWGIPSVIFSRELAGGLSHCGLREYQIPGQSGQARAHVNLSARQAKVQGLMIPATYGPSSIGSLGSANLQQSLENRLRARLDGDGSPEYALTWKHWDMPLGQPICALRASARRISGKGCSGWVTPQTRDSKGNGQCRDRDKGVNLDEQAALAGWPTPNCPNGGRSIGHVSEWKGNTPYSSDGRKIQLDTQAIARMAGYNTPRATDGTHGGPNQTGGSLPADAALLGGGDIWIQCADGKSRRIESRTQPLVNGVPRGMVPSSDPSAPGYAENTGEARAMRLRGYGNAIHPELAAEFIAAFFSRED